MFFFVDFMTHQSRYLSNYSMTFRYRMVRNSTAKLMEFFSPEAVAQVVVRIFFMQNDIICDTAAE
jgi:hypothetical protein